MRKITQKEWKQRLKKARVRNKQLKAEGKPLPNPTKDWSEESWENIIIALSGKNS